MSTATPASFSIASVTRAATCGSQVHNIVKERSRIPMFSRFILCTVVLFTFCHIHAQTPVVPKQTEVDPNLPPKGGSWSLREATVTDPSLPRVLLIGDSITNGYLEPVRKTLAGKANIDAWITPTTQADQSLPKTIAAILAWQKYAVIHFNLGLHSWQKGRIPEGQYQLLTEAVTKSIATTLEEQKGK